MQEAGHPEEIEKTEEKGESLPVDLVKLAKIAISPALGKGLAEFEVAFNTPQNTGNRIGKGGGKSAEPQSQKPRIPFLQPQGRGR